MPASLGECDLSSLQNARALADDVNERKKKKKKEKKKKKKEREREDAGEDAGFRRKDTTIAKNKQTKTTRKTNFSPAITILGPLSIALRLRPAYRFRPDS